MMNEFYMEMEVGDANPLSFLSLESPPASPAFFGDLPALLALAVNFEGEVFFKFLFGDPNVWPPILLGDCPAIVPYFLKLFFNPGESCS